MICDEERKRSSTVVKFLCSYGGRIVPRPGDGKLRYSGGLTRVLAVDRYITFAELMVKLGEFCGYSVDLRCQLPKGDLEILVSIKSDAELAMILEEYEHSAPGSKIRCVLSRPMGLKSISPTSSVDLSPVSPSYTLSGSDSPPLAPPASLLYSKYGYNRRCAQENHRLLFCDPRYHQYQQ